MTENEMLKKMYGELKAYGKSVRLQRIRDAVAAALSTPPKADASEEAMPEASPSPFDDIPGEELDELAAPSPGEDELEEDDKED